MLTLRPTDHVAIEKRLASLGAPVISLNASTIDAGDADGFLPGERLQQEDAPARLHRQGRTTDVALDAPSIQSDVRVRLFAVALVGLLCVMVIGFVSEMRPRNSDLPDYGYDEALETETSSLSSLNFPSSCSDDSQATAGASKDGLDRLGVSAVAARAAASPTASFTPRE